MLNSTIDVRPYAGALGAVIDGVDLSQPLPDRTYREIRNALNEHGVIFFYDQDITPDQHLAFGRRFGDIYASKTTGKVPGHPQVIELRKEPNDRHNHGGEWHTDQVYTDVPLGGSILLARELPPAGGDTMFANMAKAYDSLSPGLKKTLEGLRAVHSVKKRIDVVGVPVQKVKNAAGEAMEIDHKLPPADLERQAIHPAVIRHPETGRKILYVNPTYTVRFEGWTVKESEPLLEYLYKHGSRAENTCRFHWRVGAIAFWDNWTCWHYAVQDYDGYRRLMHRVSVYGQTPIPADA